MRVMPPKGDTMNIFLNQKEFSLDNECATVADLVAAAAIPATGTAVAVNNRVVPKKEWADTQLAQGDNVTVITAVCGG